MKWLVRNVLNMQRYVTVTVPTSRIWVLLCFFLCRYVLVKFGFLTEFLDWFFLDTFTLLLFNVSGKFLGQLVLPQDSAECRPDRGPSTA